jgi:entericidin A
MNKLFVLIAFGLTLALGGCNTWHGFGKDISKMGDRIQKSPNNR